ncbi:hypothetical protein [Streptomyces griseus]|uniref:hypothetical protein n=1 Tax=Streptomyces griseus TaxID=1911 RepID=UPI0036375789
MRSRPRGSAYAASPAGVSPAQPMQPSGRTRRAPVRTPAGPVPGTYTHRRARHRGKRDVRAQGRQRAFDPADGFRTGDQWLDVENPEQVDAVLLIPDDQSSNRRTCAADGEDGGGTHPPESPSRGDQL